MGIRKVKYTSQEVEYLISKIKGEYENKLLEQKELNIELNKELAGLRADYNTIKEKEELIYKTLERAERTAEELEKSCEEQYQLEIERIKRFVVRWNNYFKTLKDEYPQNSAVKKAISIKDKVEAASRHNAKKLIGEIDKVLPDDKKKKFDPKKKINEYIAATGDNGFNLDEVLNPGELQLEDLCKELGLMGGNE